MNIKQKRIEKGLTQKQLADKLNIPYQMLQRWENGKFSPNAKHLLNLSLALECSLQDLI